VDKASEGRSGDIHVALPGIGNIILDIKHHAKGSGGVRKKDRDKLLRDIDDDKNGAVGGILVATQASIQGMEPCSVLWSPKHHRPMVACELRGDWGRLCDARSVLSCVLFRDDGGRCPDDNETGIHKEEIGKIFTDSIGKIKTIRNDLFEKVVAMNQIIGTLLLERSKFTGKGTDSRELEDWVLEHCASCSYSVDLKKVYDTHTHITPKKKLTIRDMFVRMGAKIM
jgi:hypothetical protein